MKRSRSNTDSVFDEPHLNPPSRDVRDEEAPPLDSVHLEPSAAEKSDLYGLWLEKQLKQQTPGRAWSLTLLLSLIAGPLAIFTAFTNTTGGSSFLIMVVIAPLVEEMGKIIAPLMVVERNPARFTSGAQPVVCALAGGLVFSVIENLLYLNVYIENPGAAIIAWRWTVCVALHTGCSFAAGCGVAAIRRQSLSERQPPRMEKGAFLIIAAVVIHGGYNLIALLIDPIFG
jgi:RsiW-degrading membrane proteinase PrsW (M82 family)